MDTLIILISNISKLAIFYELFVSIFTNLLIIDDILCLFVCFYNVDGYEFIFFVFHILNLFYKGHSGSKSATIIEICCRLILIFFGLTVYFVDDYYWINYYTDLLLFVEFIKVIISFIKLWLIYKKN